MNDTSHCTLRSESLAPGEPSRSRAILAALEPVLIDARAAAAACGVARSTFLAWDASGMNPRPIRLGGRVLWSVDDLRRWAAAGCPGREEFERLKEGTA